MIFNDLRALTIFHSIETMTTQNVQTLNKPPRVNPVTNRSPEKARHAFTSTCLSARKRKPCAMSTLQTSSSVSRIAYLSKARICSSLAEKNKTSPSSYVSPVLHTNCLAQALTQHNPVFFHQWSPPFFIWDLDGCTHNFRVSCASLLRVSTSSPSITHACGYVS